MKKLALCVLLAVVSATAFATDYTLDGACTVLSLSRCSTGGLILLI